VELGGSGYNIRHRYSGIEKLTFLLAFVLGRLSDDHLRLKLCMGLVRRIGVHHEGLLRFGGMLLLLLVVELLSPYIISTTLY
jgi:hypothetical protein